MRTDEAPSVWLYSDPHFDHTNIIKYCNRPFTATADMNQSLLHEYRVRVKPRDTVYFLGDMTFGRGSKGAIYWLNALQTDRQGVRFHYIVGSHDNGIQTSSTPLPIVEVVNEKIIEIEGERVLLIHDPAQVDPTWKGWVIHGHVHNYRPVLWRNDRINVSCDAVGFRPVSINYIVNLMKEENNDLSRRRTTIPKSTITCSSTTRRVC